MKIPDQQDLQSTYDRLREYVVRTPVARLNSPVIDSLGIASVTLKLELMQHTGTFKFRGAINNLLQLDAAKNRRITAVSAGNHAVAVACAASRLGFDARIVMLASANPARRALATGYGADLLYCDTGAQAFARAEELIASENRIMIHPFDGFPVASASGGISLELLQDAGPLDAVIVSVGGGGLAGGVANAIRQMAPAVKVFGVEPEGADCMTKSLEAGRAVTGQTVNTIADSLGPPLTTDYTYQLCRDCLDDLVTVSDDEICGAMHMLFADAKLAVEPAGAAALAGVVGPLCERLQGKNIGVIVCGACLDADSFLRDLKRGEAVRQA